MDSKFDILLVRLLTIKELLLGKAYLRYSKILIYAGAPLVICGLGFVQTLIIQIFSISEKNSDSVLVLFERAQWVGVVMIIISIFIFIYFYKNDDSKTRRLIPASIIASWSAHVSPSPEQDAWFDQHPRLESKFWDIAHDVSISKKDRIKKLRKWLNRI